MIRDEISLPRVRNFSEILTFMALSYKKVSLSHRPDTTGSRISPLSVRFYTSGAPLQKKPLDISVECGTLTTDEREERMRITWERNETCADGHGVEPGIRTDTVNEFVQLTYETLIIDEREVAWLADDCGCWRDTYGEVWSDIIISP